MCPKSSNLFHALTYYIKWVTTSWTDSKVVSRRITSVLSWGHISSLPEPRKTITYQIGMSCNLATFK